MIFFRPRQKHNFPTKEICCPTFEFSVFYCTRFELWHVLILSAFVVRGSHVLICRRITMFCMVISKWKCSPNFNSCVFTILHAMSSTMRVLVVGGCHRVGGRGSAPATVGDSRLAPKYPHPGCRQSRGKTLK